MAIVNELDQIFSPTLYAKDKNKAKAKSPNIIPKK